MLHIGLAVRLPAEERLPVEQADPAFGQFRVSQRLERIGDLGRLGLVAGTALRRNCGEGYGFCRWHGDGAALAAESERGESQGEENSNGYDGCG